MISMYKSFIEDNDINIIELLEENVKYDFENIFEEIYGEIAQEKAVKLEEKEITDEKIVQFLINGFDLSN